MRTFLFVSKYLDGFRMGTSLTPHKRRLQAGHADGLGLGGPRTDDGDQIPNSGSNPLEGTLNGV